MGSSCDFSCPLVIINKKDGGIRMEVNYRELNMQLEATAISADFISKIGGKQFYAKVGNLWGYHQLRLTEDCSKFTAIITLWRVYRFLACPLGISTASGEYQARMAHENLQDYYLNGAIVCIDDTVIYGSTWMVF